jgi:methylenetetrahydrofolate dehydrogenase (NADP+) / methenyltetrahydrofolate cyclohydrolase
MARLIRGAEVAARINEQTTASVVDLLAKGIHPCLVVVYIGKNKDDASYRCEIRKQAKVVGITVREIALSETIEPEELRTLLRDLNRDPEVHGVLVQTIRDEDLKRAVPRHLSNAIDPEGVTLDHMGALMFGDIEVSPCTPTACFTLIKEVVPDLQGVDVVVINSSPVIGRPLFILLSLAGATVQVCNRHTKDLVKKCRAAEVIVTATGKQGLITAEHVRTGKTVVIDASIIRTDEGLTGDVCFEEVARKCRAITPVPGGVGPVTTATLLDNVARLANISHRRLRK